MGVPGGVDHVTWSGGLAGGERWAAGYWSGIGSTPNTAQEQADAIYDQAGAGSFFSALMSIMATTTTVSAITVYRYEASNSHATDKGVKSFTPVAGTGTGSHPDQIALVTTYRSAQLMRSGRNRSYWPGTGIAMATQGLLNTTPVDAFVDALGALLEGTIPLVVSSSRTAHYPMISVDADYIADQQTRRRRSLASGRHVHSLT